MHRFEEITKYMSSIDVLNLYRNMFYTEPDTTEQGIVARAINDILPKYIAMLNPESVTAGALMPVPIGSVVYAIKGNNIFPRTLASFEINKSGLWAKGKNQEILGEWNRSVFATEEEAITDLLTYGGNE